MTCMLDILERCIDTCSRPESLLQMRGQIRHVTACTVTNSVIQQFSTLSTQGVGVRARVDHGCWGFSSVNTVEASQVDNAAREAAALSKAASQGSQDHVEFEPQKAVTDAVSAPVKVSPSGSAEEIVDIPMRACRSALEAGSEIKDCKVTYISMENHTYFASSEGSRIIQHTTRIMLFVNVVARRNATVCPCSDSVGHTGGWEIFDKTSPEELGQTVAEKAVHLLDARTPPSGTFRVIIDPKLCATLLHEAIGHPLEADLAMAGGGFGTQLNRLVCSELVSIYDDGRIPGGLGYFFYDDEGTPCTRTTLIKKGVLKSFMHDRESASVSGGLPTGNAHAWDYSVEPLIRQTNIGIEPGEYTIEEMVEGVTDGLFLEGTFGGQADSNADFTFGFQSARAIRKGEVTEEFRGANVAGNAIDVFKTIDAVSDTPVLRPGACGKYQFAIQGRMVPAIRCRIMVGGTGG
ncbi:MAG: TldD/PmbA family protein [Theionarchaea archaeon]|nr:TldD/PmbA family protein [Theionarchaea archaeon]